LKSAELPKPKHAWCEDTLVSKHGLFTLRESNLEIRGDGWEGRKRKGDTPMTDRPRICRFDTPEDAKNIAERVIDLLDEYENQKNNREPQQPQEKHPAETQGSH
jgi:hypothetical protein